MLFASISPGTIVFGILTFGFTIYIVTKMIKEIRLNKLLKMKQTSMRMTQTTHAFHKRMGVLSLSAIAPILILTLILAFGTNAPVLPDGNVLEIRSNRDIVEIFNAYKDRVRNDGQSPVFSEDDLEMAPEDAGGDQGSDDYSETNVQVQGVDEMDNVITDGKYIYQIQHNQVYITLAYTQSQGSNALSNHKVIDYVNEETLCPSGMYITGLYVDDNHLIVVGSEYEYFCQADPERDDELTEPFYYDYWYGYNNNVKVYVYDKNNDFELTSEYDLDGNLIGTRKIDDNIFIITSTYIPYQQEDIDVEPYLPFYENNGTLTTAEFSDIVYVNGTTPNSFTNFYALDLDNEHVDLEVVLGDSGYNLYVSHNAIYLVGNIYSYISDTNEEDEEVWTYENKTAIQKISIDDADLEFEAVGMIPGYTLNQFSMDEKDGYLRIATTSGWWGEEINNRVFVLNEDLEEVSRLENLGKPGETIRSVRFVGDYGYVVTFEQTDPFYVINLSDPANPFTEGELEIPGFSTYLQPLSDDYMLGVGFGDSEGGTSGLKISVYDISDKTNPFVFDEVIFDYAEFGWAWSSATYNHKDMLVSLAKGIIALPFSTYDYSETDGYTYNSGILVYNFDETDGLSKSGFVSHETDSDENVYVYKIKFIDQYFYTISNKYIMASLISDPETIINSVNLPEYQYETIGDEEIVD